jgi:transposase
VSTKEEMDTSSGVRRRNKSWPEALKRQIVAASLAPGASVSMVARQFDVNTNLVFTWRKRYGEEPDAGAPQLVPLVVTPDQPVAAPSSPAADLVEIDLPRGCRIRISGNIKAATLRVVLDVLDRR